MTPRLSPIRATVLLILFSIAFGAAAQGLTAASKLPIIDMHFHPDPAWDALVFVKLLDELGVAKAGNGAREQGPDTDKVALDFVQQNPDRFFAFGFAGIRGILVEEQEPAWKLETDSIRNALARLESDLRAGKLKGIGEIHANTETSRPMRRDRFPADSPLMQQLCKLSETYQVPLNVHMDSTDQSVGEMERMLSSNRGCIWIWAHSGSFAQPPLLRQLLQRHSNLYLDLSDRVGPTRYEDRIDDEGQLKSGWKDLLEEYQDRIVIGTDRAKPSVKPYSTVIRYWREVLPQLSPQAAAKIAHGNARRLLKLSSSE